MSTMPWGYRTNDPTARRCPVIGEEIGADCCLEEGHALPHFHLAAYRPWLSAQDSQDLARGLFEFLAAPREWQERAG